MAEDQKEDAAKRECPFCVYMRKGGCGKEFDDFMMCGIIAEKEGKEYSECIEKFDAMKRCMDANKEKYEEIMHEIQDAAEEAIGMDPEKLPEPSS